MTTSVSVSAPVTLLAAVSLQTVDPETKLATIEVTTNLLAPYKLSAENLTLLPNDPAYADYTYSVSEVGSPELCPKYASTSSL